MQKQLGMSECCQRCQGSRDHVQTTLDCPIPAWPDLGNMSGLGALPWALASWRQALF